VNRKLRLTLTILLTCGIASMTGCGNPRVVLMHPTGVMRAGPDVKGHVYVKIDGEWTLSKNRLQIPEGFYITDLD